MSKSLRNICIIAHVDHGKTTLVDFLLKQAGTFQAHEATADRMMDSDSQERERGITISAKNASFRLDDVKVNVVDTPGHADFGGEVERIMDMVDGAILLVDAVEGPLPQTRFVLQKAIGKGLKIVLCINKVDRPEAIGNDMVKECVNKAFDLFVELGASDEQCDFPIIYACARQGWCTSELDKIPTFLNNGPAERTLKPLFDEILKIPAPSGNPEGEMQLLVSNIAYSEYLGNLALGRVVHGAVRRGQDLMRHGLAENGNKITQKFQVTKLLSYEGMKQVEVESIGTGDIGLIAGSEFLDIGDTLSGLEGTALNRIKVEEPTMRMIFSVNTTPNSGREGKAVQSRDLRQRLFNETRSNVALRLEDTETSDQYYLLGRGELQFGILIEKMRREGMEFMVGRPNVLMREEGGQKMEPVERMTLDLPESCAGDVTKMYQQRKGTLISYEAGTTSGDEPRVRLTFEIPTRGMLGTNSMYKTATRGAGLISSESIGYKPHAGTIFHRATGSLISDRIGRTTEYALASVQERGLLFLGEGVDVYEGMIIGECAKDNDLNVNPVKPKKLTNMRTTGSDGITNLYGTKKMGLEKCIEWIDDDEWIEVTPKSVRLRKKILAANLRSVRRSDKA